MGHFMMSRRMFSRVIGARLQTNDFSSISLSTSFFSTKSDAVDDSRPTKVAFIGLGNMGLPMAVNLNQALLLNQQQPQSDSSSTSTSHAVVVVYDTHPDTMIKAQELGLETISSSTSSSSSSAIEELLLAGDEQPSVLITMLPNDAAVNTVMKTVVDTITNDNSSNTSPSLRTIIDCSTVSPTTSRYWYNTLSSRHSNQKDSTAPGDGGDDDDRTILFVDAPVSGGVKGAQDATLTFMVGANTDVVEQHHVESILKTMGQRVVPCGGPGSGAAVKLCNNLALAAQMVGIAEAMNLGDALGVDPVTLANVMNMSTAKSWSCEVNNPHPNVAQQTNSPASNDYVGGFGTKLMLKDLGLAIEAGNHSNVSLPIGTTAKELYRMADLRGLGDKDFGVVLQFLRGR